MKRFLFYLLCVMANITTLHADTINMQWYNEDGTVYDTTTCSAGDDIILPTAPTKRGYTFVGWKQFTPIEYIYVGQGQYLDSGLTLNRDIRVRIKFSQSNAYGGTVFGSYDSTRFFALNSSSSFYFDYNGGRITKGGFVPNKIYDFEIGTWYVQDWETKEFFMGSIRNDLVVTTPSLPLYFFYANTDIGNIYLIQIWNNDVLVRDLVPALDQTGVACMFDNVSAQFFYNADSNTGNFIAGPVVSEQ